jgi:Hexapeptide repeat of succinyl-transferase
MFSCMTLPGRLTALFPFLHVMTCLTCLGLFVSRPSLALCSLFFCVVYLLPPALFRLYVFAYPIKNGKTILSSPVRSGWWFAHQLQLVYGAFPALEAFLRLIPGAYSAWLRLWGSTIGRNVYWTPRVEIIDRHLMQIGDNVVFGHRAVCAAHIIFRKKTGDVVLIARPIIIGKNTVIGAGAHIGPGVRIATNTTVPHDARYRIRYAA